VKNRSSNTRKRNKVRVSIGKLFLLSYRFQNTKQWEAPFEKISGQNISIRIRIRIRIRKKWIRFHNTGLKRWLINALTETCSSMSVRQCCGAGAASFWWRRSRNAMAKRCSLGWSFNIILYVTGYYYFHSIFSGQNFNHLNFVLSNPPPPPTHTKQQPHHDFFTVLLLHGSPRRVAGNWLYCRCLR
jgi:hypothetical protein